ncbi:MAG: PEP/pyruvate-binding domain-containing protein [Planctomycetota bacterium]
MSAADTKPTTGVESLDRLLGGLLAGDNLVWQISSMADYSPFVRPYWTQAAARGERVIYIRFARHEPLVDERPGVEVHRLSPDDGFESFISEIHRIIESVGRGGNYVFDCLSELVVDWFSDRMVGNFFRLVCPYLFDQGAIAYFPLMRNHHSFHATGPISETTQILIDIYRHKGKLFVHPIKVEFRHSPTMYMLHVWDEEFRPLTRSDVTAEILGGSPWERRDGASARLEYGSSTFERAEQVERALKEGKPPAEDADALTQRLLRMTIARSGPILELATRHLQLADILRVRDRMIGTGLIGGKSVGMLVARAVLEKTDAAWHDALEPHDSFFVGSDVFYTYLVQNGLWWTKQKQKDSATFLDGADLARKKMLAGSFPDYIVDEFADMLDYFGQSPVIVRSSSLLEDNYGNAFAGKYESVFCVNQGTPEKRLESFLDAVRRAYASTMSETVLRYRAERGVLGRDEQMALLVQRVSGAAYGRRYFPQVAGVGLSFNPYVWSEHIDPQAGVLRLVFGLGTRAVDRRDDDYTRVVALNAPERRPESKLADARRYAQRKADTLDLETNQHVSGEFDDIGRESPGLPLELFVSRDPELERLAHAGRAGSVFPYFLTFDQLLRRTSFVERMRKMLRTLAEAYDCPVDIEFTANFYGADDYRINLVQCRPFQVKGGGAIVSPPVGLRPQQRVIVSLGPVVGRSCEVSVERVIYVVPAVYGKLPERDRYAAARVVGQLVRQSPRSGRVTMLLGPGRWCTTMPALGVPVSFAEISTAQIICEIAAMHESLVPDVSLGTHFFHELVETDILYFALFPGKDGNVIRTDFFEGTRNLLPDLLPGAARWADVIRVISAPEWGAGRTLRLNANTLTQEIVCYLGRSG